MPRVMLGVGAALLVLFGCLALWLDRPSPDHESSLQALGKVDVTPGAIYAARFLDIEGKSQELGQWQHQLLIINFWATWCAPCKAEMPMLAKLQEAHGMHGVQIVGIAVDSRENVDKFAKQTPMGYPLLPDETGAIEFSKRLGNRLGLLPYTVVIAPGGNVIFSHVGIVTELMMIDLIIKNTENTAK
ncbi:MAG: TlpA disulfide reductase family protein [Betaproteobacteria bacterium]